MFRNSEIRMAVVYVLLILSWPILSTISFAAEGEKSSAEPLKGSFFQGTWVGEWTGRENISVRQGAVIEVGPEIKEGVYEVKYSWEEAQYMKKTVLKTVPAGKIKTEGTMRGEVFYFSWKNKRGRTFEMTLKKLEDNRVKARVEHSVTWEYGRPYNETTLKRK